MSLKLKGGVDAIVLPLTHVNWKSAKSLSAIVRAVLKHSYCSSTRTLFGPEWTCPIANATTGFRGSWATQTFAQNNPCTEHHHYVTKDSLIRVYRIAFTMRCFIWKNMSTGTFVWFFLTYYGYDSTLSLWLIQIFIAVGTEGLTGSLWLLIIGKHLY
jgi:hypothetical protein